MNNTYICDVEEIKAVCTKLINNLENLQSLISECGGIVNEHLIMSWKGDAANAFLNSYTAQDKKIQELNKIAQDLVTFIQNTSIEIETQDKSFERYGV